MTDIRKEQERDELHRAIWAIADELRGSVDGWDFKWGRGIEKIKDSCEEAGNPMPEYTIKREDIMVMFKSLVSSTDQGTNQANQGADNSVVTRILKVIQEDPTMSQKKISEAIGEKYSTVKYYMESMKKSGVIEREGSSQQGKGVVL